MILDIGIDIEMNGIERKVKKHKINPDIYAQLVLSKVAKTIQWV